MQTFLDALADSPQWYVLALLLSATGIVLLAKASTATWYDPWALQQVQTIFATAAVIFMGIAGVIKPSLLIYHIVAISCFLLCAGQCFKQAVRVHWGARRVKQSPLSSLRTALFLLFVGAQLGAWALGGIPIFLESRLDAFSSGGGIGVLSRIISFTSFAALFLTVLRVGVSRRKKLSFTDWLVLLFIVISSVANASKTSIVLTLFIILMSHWFFKHLFQDYEAPRISFQKFAVLGLILGFLFLLPVAIEQARGGVDPTVGGPLVAVAFRLIFSGDGYMWMYGDDYLSYVKVSNPTALFFADFLGATRLVPWDQLPVHPGLQIYRDLFPDSDAIKGPNIRVDAFGLLYGSMVFGTFFSALLGGLFGLLRTWVFKVRSAILFVPAAYLFFQAPTFIVDPVLGITAVVNTIFAIITMIMAVALIGQDPFGSGARAMYRDFHVDRN